MKQLARVQAPGGWRPESLLGVTRDRASKAGRVGLVAARSATRPTNLRCWDVNPAFLVAREEQCARSGLRFLHPTGQHALCNRLVMVYPVTTYKSAPALVAQPGA
jgi:hypothetical protein